MTITELLSAYSPTTRTIVYNLRNIVKDALPDAEERIYPGWRGIGFHHSTAGYICGIFPSGRCVKMYFEHGKLLPDPERILAGDGTQTKYLEIRDVNKIPVDAIINLLGESIEFRLMRLKK